MMTFRLKKQPKKGLHHQLAASGWFQQGHGPWGFCPVQLSGRLVNGEWAYFRSRGREVSLEISSADDPDCDNPHRVFKQEVFVDHEVGAGALPVADAVRFIEMWLTEYLGEKPAKQEARKMGGVRAWWASLEDRQFLGVNLSFATTGSYRLSFSSKKDMFHNGNRPVRGMALQVGPLVLHLSSARCWQG